jgi:uncharacterized protein (TIGR02996 family)
MGTGSGLLRAVVADPADDTPRLVYADWLDEHDQPGRAALIRVQVELARVVASGDVRKWGTARRRFDELRSQEAALLGPPGPPGAQPGRQWVLPPGLNDAWPRGVGGWEWHRGFPERWWCPLHLWTKFGRTIAVQTPVRQVIVTDRTPAVMGPTPATADRAWHRTDDSRWADPPPDPSFIPVELFDLLPDDPFDLELLGVTRRYPTADAAHAALSEACVEWARAAVPQGN